AAPSARVSCSLCVSTMSRSSMFEMIPPESAHVELVARGCPRPRRRPLARDHLDRANRDERTQSPFLQALVGAIDYRPRRGADQPPHGDLAGGGLTVKPALQGLRQPPLRAGAPDQPRSPPGAR